MFKQLKPLLAERKIHILVSTTNDDKLTLYIEPAKTSDKEEAAFTTPFSVQATAEELDEKLDAILEQWIGARKQVCASLQEALAASTKEMERQAEEAKKKAAEKNKKIVPGSKAATPGNKPATPVTKAAAVVTAAAPALVDDDNATASSGATQAVGGNGGEDEAGGSGSGTTQSAGGVLPNSPIQTGDPAPQQAAATVAEESGETVSLF